MSTKAILAGYYTNDDNRFWASMEEMKALCLADDIEVIETVFQKGIGPLHSSYFKSGKLEEIRQLKEELGAETVVINDELNASQIMAMEAALDCGIVDRTSLILNIFHDRAKTKQAHLQVEIARLQYALPRLLGSYSDLGRQGGVGGARNKGLGEKKIALDKRRIERQIHNLKKELKEIEKHHQTQSEGRNKSSVKKAALVGYTNAGKSTLMNALLKGCAQQHKQVFEKDMLFATLDTSVRLIDLNNQPPFLLADTVGFVENLPPVLLEAFKTTLAEVKDADLLLHVIDLSSEDYSGYEESTIQTLTEIEASNISMLKVYTHGDLVDPEFWPEDGIVVSSINGQGIDRLTEEIVQCLYGKKEVMNLFFPYENSGDYFRLIQNVEVLEKSEQDFGIDVKVKGVASALMQIQKWKKE